MADIYFVSDTLPMSPRRSSGDAGEESAIDFELIEFFFFAYRDFVAEPDQALSALGFGRAHHRVLHFVNRAPGLSVTDLLDTLRITKQSLGRVLKQLIDDGYIEQEQGPVDRRQRLLRTTPKGRRLALDLAAGQSRRIEAALADMPEGTRGTVRAFLDRMVDRTANQAPIDDET